MFISGNRREATSRRLVLERQDELPWIAVFLSWCWRVLSDWLSRLDIEAELSEYPDGACLAALEIT
jgi:hypothetical protein